MLTFSLLLFIFFFFTKKYFWKREIHGSKYECGMNGAELELQAGYSPGFSLCTQEPYSVFSKNNDNIWDQ